MSRPLLRSVSRSVVLLAALTSGVAASAQDRESRLEGRSLAEALQSLQALGLRIVFTSSIVTPELRVEAEPRGRTLRERLEDLLEPHRLEARDGPGGTIQIVRAPGKDSPGTRVAPTGTIEGRVVHWSTGTGLAEVTVEVDGADSVRTGAGGRFILRDVPAGSRIVRASIGGSAAVERVVRVTGGATAAVTLVIQPATGTHSEHLTVRGVRTPDFGVAAEARLTRHQWEAMNPVLADQPSRALHALPRVSLLDDFRSEFTVRGSPLRHIGFVVDGVSAPWLQHAAHGRGVTASLSMLTGLVLEEATVRAGAYPRRHDDQLGAELELTIREGSRTGTRLRGAVGGPNATVVGEGPLRSGRGSWLVAARQSFLEWPGDGAEGTRAAFGFSDALAKVVYDVTPRQQVSLGLLAGRSLVDGEDNPAPGLAGDGTNRAAVVNVALRSALGRSSLLTQRAYVAHHGFGNDDGQGTRLGGTRTEAVYRADLATALAGGVFEAGAQVARTEARHESGGSIFPVPSVEPPSSTVVFSGSSWRQAVYANFAWAPRAGVRLSPGLRITSSTDLARPALSPWMLLRWDVAPAWTITGSAGISHQLPDVGRVSGSLASPRAPERAAYVDLGVEQRVGRSVRWQATVFARHETGVREDADVMWMDLTALSGGLQGRARGAELLVECLSRERLSGWLAYSYGMARYTDPGSGETFWADLDLRHVFSAFGTFRVSERTSAGATLRAGSNFPIPGYLLARDERLFLGTRRNEVRLPAYARLDVRAEHRLRAFGRRLTAFAELQNVMNRRNVGLANGVVRPTGEAVGFTSPLFPRRVTAGILVEF